MVKAITIGRGNYRRIRSALGLELELGRPKLGPSFSVEPPCVISAAVDSRTNVTVGAFTYISPTDGIGRFIHNCDIGRYCSIAAGVWVAPGDHPTTWLSSSSVQYDYSAFAWSEQVLGRASTAARTWVASKRVTIGNDVWIGRGAFIRQGVTIGNGAVIAAHAVVVKNVPPCAIVGGCSAKVIRYRFDEATIKEIEELKWWDYDLADFGDLDWSDVNGTLSRIRERIAGGVRSYAPLKVGNLDFRPYARSTPFFWEWSRHGIRVKLFGIWLVHWMRGRGIGK